MSVSKSFKQTINSCSTILWLATVCYDLDAAVITFLAIPSSEYFFIQLREKEKMCNVSPKLLENGYKTSCMYWTFVISLQHLEICLLTFCTPHFLIGSLNESNKTFYTKINPKVRA